MPHLEIQMESVRDGAPEAHEMVPLGPSTQIDINNEANEPKNEQNER